MIELKRLVFVRSLQHCGLHQASVRRAACTPRTSQRIMYLLTPRALERNHGDQSENRIRISTRESPLEFSSSRFVCQICHICFRVGIARVSGRSANSNGSLTARLKIAAEAETSQSPSIEGLRTLLGIIGYTCGLSMKRTVE